MAVVANLGGGDLAEALGGDVERLLVDTDSGILSPLMPLPLLQSFLHPSVPGRHGYQALTPEIEHRNKCFLRKKAALCLLQLFRTHPDCLDLASWAHQMTPILEENDIGQWLSVSRTLLSSYLC